MIFCSIQWTEIRNVLCVPIRLWIYSFELLSKEEETKMRRSNISDKRSKGKSRDLLAGLQVPKISRLNFETSIPRKLALSGCHALCDKCDPISGTNWFWDAARNTLRQLDFWRMGNMDRKAREIKFTFVLGTQKSYAKRWLSAFCHDWGKV